MTTIIKCDECDQEVIKDSTKHICNACQTTRDPKAWKAKSDSNYCCDGNEFENEPVN